MEIWGLNQKFQRFVDTLMDYHHPQNLPILSRDEKVVAIFQILQTNRVKTLTILAERCGEQTDRQTDRHKVLLVF